MKTKLKWQNQVNLSDKERPKTTLLKKKKIWYKQSFNMKWLIDSEFEDWLKPHKGDHNLAICTLCRTRFKNPNRNALLKHAQSKKHRKSKAAAKQVNSKKSICLDDKVAKAEVLLAAFMTKYNTSFSQSDHLVETIKAAFPDSRIVKKIDLDKIKASHDVMRLGIA